MPEALLLYREHGSSVTGSMSSVDAAAFDEATTAIRWENLRAVFGEQARAEDARLLSTYRRDFNTRKAECFLTDFDRLAAERKSGGLGRVQAVQLAELAYRVLQVGRWKAAALFGRALKLNPELVSALPWLRIAALFLFGERVRKVGRTIAGA